MEPAAALDSLRAAGLDVRHAEPILGGWAFWTFDVDGEWIARFARDDDIGAAARRELALLPALASHLSYATPRPEYDGEHGGLPFFAYRRIPGRGMRTADATPTFLQSVGRMLVELHSFPVDRAAELLGTGPADDAWRAHFERLHPIIESVALPTLDVELAARVRAEFDHLLDLTRGITPTLVHNDLGLEHVLVDDATCAPTGIIDFESAWVGDPAIDLVGIAIALGDEAASAVAGDRDLGPNMHERIWHYTWMGSVHAVIHAVRTNDGAELDAARAELRRRISRRGRAARG